LDYFCTRSLQENTDFFPTKIRDSFNGCPLKAVVRDQYGFIGTYYINDNVSSGIDIKVFEIDLLRIILKQMNVSFVYVLKPEGFKIEEGSVNNLVSAMIAKEAYIALGVVTSNFKCYTSFTLTNNHFTTRHLWYVLCPVKYPRWSSIFKTLSLDLWIFLSYRLCLRLF
jgi:hypothetical protein